MIGVKTHENFAKRNKRDNNVKFYVEIIKNTATHRFSSR